MTPLETALVYTIRLALGPSADVRWEDASSTWADDTLSVRLQYVSRTRIGRDERRYRPPAVGLGLLEVIRGNRVSRVQVTINANAHGVAVDVADALTAHMHASVVEAAFAAINVSAPRPEAVRQINAQDAHGDVRSIAVFEILFNTTLIVARAEDVGRIAAADVDGLIDGAIPVGPGEVLG